jgi:hypothetical protein
MFKKLYKTIIQYLCIRRKGIKGYFGARKNYKTASGNLVVTLPIIRKCKQSHGFKSNP